MAMRIIPFISAAILLAACASTSPQTSSSSEAAGLPTSELSPGQCGLFGWSTDETRSFIFYADEETARYAGPDGPIDLIAQSAFPATDYTDPSGAVVTLRLGEGEAMSGGMRFPGARIATLTEEGWERLHPVAIVRSCQPST